LSLAANIAKQIQILYSANAPEVAYEKSLVIIQSEITYVMDQTYKEVLKDVRASFGLSVNKLDDAFSNREKNST